MGYFIFIIVFLMFYILFLHMRWQKKMTIYTGKIREEETQLIHLEKMASLGTLSAGVAHEINNPLTFLITNLSLMKQYVMEINMQDKEKEDEMQETLDECMDGAERIKRIVHDLLTFSHPSRGKKMLVDINELLDVTVRILWNEIKYKVDVIKDYQGSKKLFVDPTQLSQVFLNLILNAVHAVKAKVKEGKGTVKVSTLEDEKSLIIRVSDTGCGIPESKLKEIFMPFYTTKGGPGLGLSVSKGIIENFKGTIEVDSKVGEGSTFTVIFPKETETGK